MVAVALVALAGVVIVSLALGQRPVPFDEVLAALVAPIDGDADHSAVRDQRLPRTLVGLLVGAALGLAGTVMQGVTRNPLADPGILGINAGAALLVVVGITWFGVTTVGGLVWFALAGAAAAIALVYSLSAIGREGATPVKLAIAGTALTAGLNALVSLVLLRDLDTLNRFRLWTTGALTSRGLDEIVLVLPLLALGAVLALASGRALNALALGDDIARGLGQHVLFARITSGAATLLLCGAATALAGPLVFVGLAAPHIARRLVGADYRWVLPLGAVAGALLVLVADVVGRFLGGRGEIEAGLVVAVLGAPLMIGLVRRSKVSGL